MTGFLYYLPGGGTQTGFAAHGLSHLEDASIRINAVTSGPDGGAGLIVAVDAGPHIVQTIDYRPAAQTWTQQPGFWLGWATDAPPTAADVALPERIDGHTVKLEKGWEVLVPIARRFPAGTALPEALVIGEGGAVIRKPLDRFAALSGGAQQIFDALTGETGELPWQTVWNTAVAAMALNYRISGAELSALELITTHNLEAIAQAMVDWPTLKAALADELEKKSIPADASLTTGAPG